ncbi:MAG: 3'(2'),5'-bisphosphate nucleotidase CysQ [Candidatus Magasanikbacteria bacterium CG10_big_fil_rev_8_21_14_0_10_43_6]|uniref:3'(2'),5-bisphosphonucleoside 3'(2')-phosphohydrolase n=1 Tax=Candidatus Magasanikbacteria bacterium CG10_big_fil_rev_8_21_14_0_10_43_6 TaxID=1974650 RepID=A0A2M6W0Q8_9BACT|nr:MAG: 3'(2'),5'-bisphosphate nucleotidase CysQ [Candidatus Magasanikbacteria bacterium CG10_big_fil_rev_8_21_14_0_10_43_6]
MKFGQELTDTIRIAEAAGTIVLRYYTQDCSVYEKENKTPVTEADLAANTYIIEEIKKISPHPILSEETKDDISRLGNDWLWIVDPLDGTKDFLNKTDEFSIMIGLVHCGNPVLGVVYQPTTGHCYLAEKGHGAFLKQDDIFTPLTVSQKNNGSDMTVVVSKSHLAKEDQLIARKLHANSFRQSGSVGIKIGLIANKQADIYYNISPYTSEWDTCAPEIIVQEAGGIMTDIFGKSLAYNQTDVTRKDGIVASNGTMHDTIIAAINSVLAETRT